MKIHILGICGTFMGGLALLARSAGHRVSGSDAGVYPPMSTQLERAGIKLCEGYAATNIEPDTELVVIGNALSRGNEAVEYVLDRGLAYASGAQWLGEHFLRGKHVLAVAGTHGKTTTASMLAWILDHAGLEPGFLIGGVPQNFGMSARNGQQYFVIEADEYDTAFFDKRSKFVHYHPQTLVLNNLEFDHADIFPDLAAIKTQFHHLVRTVPSSGALIVNDLEPNLDDVLAQGCWTPVVSFGSDQAHWHGRAIDDGYAQIELRQRDGPACSGPWRLSGEHNVLNAVAACAAAAQIGVDSAQSLAALAAFRNVKRRLELVDEVNGIAVIDDFAHHPTAIATTLAGLRRQRPSGRILVALEPRSNSMKRGAHVAELTAALAQADRVVLLQAADLSWDPARELAALGRRLQLVGDVATLVASLADTAQTGDVVVFMSNGGFDNAPRRFAGELGRAH